MDPMTLTEWAEFLTEIWNADRVDIVAQRVGGGERYYYVHDHNGHTLNLERTARRIADLFTAGDGDKETNRILNGLESERDYRDEKADAYAASRGVGLEIQSRGG